MLRRTLLACLAPRPRPSRSATGVRARARPSWPPAPPSCRPHGRFDGGACSAPSRSFFFGSGDGKGDDDGEDKKGEDEKKDAEAQVVDEAAKDDVKDDVKDEGDDVKDEGDDDEKETGDEDPAPSASLNNSSKYKRSRSSTVLGSGGAFLPPSRLGFGDQAPRYPHLLALPVPRGPVFPGVLTPLTLTDPATIAGVEKLLEGGSGGYVGLFLRRETDAAVATQGAPELITDAADLYPVGTFAQIQRLTRTGDDGGGDDGDGHVLAEDGGARSASADDPAPSASLLVMPHRRVDLLSVDALGPPVDVTVSHWERLRYVRGEDAARDDTVRALCQEVLSTIREVAQMNALFKEQVVNMVPSSHFFDMNDPLRLADFAASLSSGGDAEKLQAVLEEKDPEQRLHKALVLLSKEREVSKLQKEISAKVEEKMSEAQRKYFLTEQLKSIKKELGMEKDDKDTLIEKYRKKLAGYPAIPEEINEILNSEIDKLQTLEKNSSEFNVTRSYLDWLTGIPWGVTTEERFNISDARRVLDSDHYGMDEVKETILQFIAVGKLKGTVQGKILCLAGPPGTGKTSIAESVAAALGRKFFRFSVGGMSDVSEIKGHRRTYVGAMPGKIIQCLKSTESTNPLVLIDEIDKLGKDFRGDPASALLEVLDPGQNSTFRDHFIDAPVDISKVLFMCTANEIDRIPAPLLDRMEVIRLSGYDVPEKMIIAEKYLVPKSMVSSGLMVKESPEEETSDETDADKIETDVLKPDNEDAEKETDANQSEYTEPVYRLGEKVPQSISIAGSALESLVRWYCREAGVRNLAKKIDKITGLLSLQIVAEEEGARLTEKSRRQSDTWEVSADNLHHYVGKPLFTSDRLYEKDPLPHGVVMGLAWTSMGGTALYIETQGIRRGRDPDGKPRGGGTLKVTGQLGDVMKESTQIAYTVARARLAELAPDNSYFDVTDIHMHVPEGATPKDGPSAGVTMVTAMLSLALDRPIKSDLAMTGEVSLTGKVLPVGGIKEKIMAARRAGIKIVVVPEDCRRDYDELPDYLKEGLDINFATEYSQVESCAGLLAADVVGR